MKSALSESPGTIELTSANYANHVKGKNRYPFFIKVYNPFCAHCGIFKPFWEQFALTTASKHNAVRLGEINCNEEQKLCRDMPCSGYPCLIWSNGVDPTDLSSVMVVYDTDKLLTVFDALISTPVQYLEKNSDLQSYRESGLMFLLNYVSFDDPLCSTFYHTSNILNTTKFAMMKSDSSGIEIIYYGNRIGKMKDQKSVSQLEESVKNVIDRTFPFLDESRVSRFLKSPNKFILMIINKTDSIGNYPDLARVVPATYDNAWAYFDSAALDRIVTYLKPGDTYPVLIEYDPANETIRRYPGESFRAKQISEWLNISLASIDDTYSSDIPILMLLLLVPVVVLAVWSLWKPRSIRIDEEEELPLTVTEEEDFL